ncbi:RING finger and CHY zinc finger domain-containing 1 isoform 1 [Fagus crenata]
MQVISHARRLSRALKSPIILNSDRFISSDFRFLEAPLTSLQCRNHHTSSKTPCFSGMIQSNHLQTTQRPMYSMMSRACFASEASTTESSPTEAVKELYDKMLESVVGKRTMPPNAWLWSLLENCKNNDDIKLLFDILQNLRRFRLSNLRIHADFNCNLCREVAKTCARVGALDYGKKALWKHNVYGLSPSIGSAHHLLLYAKAHNDAKLMVEIMKLLKRNDLPLQSGTADIVFSICYNTDNWELMSKYSKKFVKAGVKLRQTSFDVWMEFAAKIGDTEALWKIEKLRSESMKQHSLVTGFSCTKGFLLEHKPEDAAAVIQVLNQTLSDAKKPGIMAELQKLVSDWPLEVIKRQKEEDRKALAASLKSDIPAMVSGLLNMGLDVNVNVEDLTREEGILY